MQKCVITMQKPFITVQKCVIPIQKYFITVQKCVITVQNSGGTTRVLAPVRETNLGLHKAMTCRGLRGDSPPENV